MSISEKNNIDSESISKREYSQGNLYVARDKNYEDEEDVPAYGVFADGSERTLIGLFWDIEIAKMFVDSAQNSDLIKKLNKVLS